MTEPLLICTDLDGTLIPDGVEPESPLARPRFAALVAQPHIHLAFVTGRHRALVEEAIAKCSLPVPQLVIADVGTTIYDTRGRDWLSWRSWQETLSAEWCPESLEHLRSRLGDIVALELQEESKQAEFKLSYYLKTASKPGEILSEVRRRMKRASLPARLVFSRDREGVGLLDLLPPSGGKLAAIEFVLDRCGLLSEQVLFAGDSGNDLEVLASRLPSVLVANATEAVRRKARQAAQKNGNSGHLYEASGGFLEMNGNYGAGVLEGVAHFRPESVECLA